VFHVSDQVRALIKSQNQFLPKPAALARASHSSFYQVAGILRDLCMLGPGLTARLNCDEISSPLSFCYKEGLRSFLFEEDYIRFPLKEELLGFFGRRKDLRVEGWLQVVHAVGTLA
jgi:DNA gyrase/topoisomerase IV subunit B